MYNPEMQISHIIQGLLAARDWTQEDLANAIGTKQNNVSRWLDGVEPRGNARDRILSMARESGVIEPERDRRPTIPIMGYVGAGARIDPDYEQVPAEGLDQVEVPLLLPDDAMGLQVRGDSMLPKYPDGFVIIVHREQTRSTASLIGEEAALRTYDGHRYLKMVMPGTKPHTYNLESFNARPILGARIAWASEILAIIPSNQVRRLTRQSKSRKPATTSRSATKRASRDRST
jgi:transcriptional regulator with XRE-family HTH domain